MESTAQNLAGNVGQLLGEEYRLVRGVGGEVIELRDDLATMNAILRMESEAEDGAVDHFVREWMKQLRELAYDAEDCVDHYKLRIKSRPSDGVRAWLQRLFQTLSSRRRVACEIRALRARAVAISERHARYGVSRDALRRRSPSFSAPPIRAAASPEQALRRPNDDPAEHHKLVGMEAQADTLVERLKERAVDGAHNLKVFSVVGFGGLGKTTLAMEVCRRLETEFPYQAMVSVSQAFEPSRDLKALLKRMLLQVVKPRTDNEIGIKEESTLGGIDGLDDKGLADKLKDVLKDTRYLIVIDDVWAIRAWESIHSMLPGNNCDSKIIVTTRIETVAKACSSASDSGHYIHHMKALEPEDSKKLFLSRVFGSESTCYPKELEDVMDNILKKCGGLPLAIVSIASVLAGYKSSESRDKWKTICKSIGSHMESNPTLEGMKHIVILSYNQLPHELKGCMMYLSIFPEDYEINKYRLLSRWIGEGLVSERRGLTLMEVAESYFEELLSRNMIEPANFLADGRMESCRVHDMLLEVMVSKSLESNFVSLLGGQYAGMSYDRIRRLSIQGADRSCRGIEQEELTDSPPKKKVVIGHGSKHGLEGMDVKHVRSLSMFRLQWHKLLDHLDKFTLLRVLDLEDCKGLTNEHVRCACRLYLLKFLSFKDTDITVVPPQIEKLEHLQVLNVQGTRLGSMIEGRRYCGLSENVTNLKKLERLLFSGANYMDRKWPMSKGLGKMKLLREVGIVILKNDVKIAQEFGELEQLEDIWISIEVFNTINENDVVQEFAKSMGKMYSLRRLVLAAEFTDTLKFLHQLPTPPRLLRCLRIMGQVGESLPNWVGSLSYLVEFRMSWAGLRDDQPFGVLCELPNLKIICVDEMCYIGNALVARTVHNFPSLVSLDVSACRAHDPRKFEFEEESMPNLERLAIFFHTYYSDIERSIVGIEHLTSLKEVRLTGDKGSTALDSALEHLKAESRTHPNQFQVVVKYR